MRLTVEIPDEAECGGGNFCQYWSMVGRSHGVEAGIFL